MHTREVKAVLRGLDKYSVYSIQVVAYTRVGEGLRSQAVFVQTKQDGESVASSYGYTMIRQAVKLVPYLFKVKCLNLNNSSFLLT